MDLMKSLFVSASGLKAQNGRMRIIAENIANADSTGRSAGDDPYRRKIPTFKSHFAKEVGAEFDKLRERSHNADPEFSRKLAEARRQMSAQRS